MSDGLEAGADLFDEKGRLLEGGEVSARSRFAPMDEVDEAPLGPFPRRHLEVLRKHRQGGGQVDLLVLRRIVDGLPIAADDAPALFSQYSMMLSSISS